LLNQIAEDYRATHPNVTITFDSIPSEYNTKLATQLAGSAPPDAGWLLERSAPTFIEAGVLADLGPQLKQDAAYNLADFSSSSMRLWQRDSAIYGVPFSTSPFFVLYNADMFEAAGVATPAEQAAQGNWTWEALAETSKALQAQAPSGSYGFATIDNEGYTGQLWAMTVPIIRAYGGDAWNAEGTECQLTSPQAIQAMQLFHRMVVTDKSVVPPGEQADFYAGQAGMTVAQISRLAKLKDASFEWGIAPLPSGPSGKPYVIGQAAIGVFNASTNKEVAADFVAFMTNQGNVAKLAQFFPPARASVLDSDAFSKANPLIDSASLSQIVVTGVKEGAVLPAHANFPEINQAAVAAFDGLWQPGADVPAVLNGVCEAITPFLQ